MEAEGIKKGHQAVFSIERVILKEQKLRIFFAVLQQEVSGFVCWQLLISKYKTVFLGIHLLDGVAGQ